MEPFSVRLLTESDIDGIVAAAGGRRAHPDADRRDKRGADYVLAESVVELKNLDDEGLDKPERQSKLASLFREHFPDRPVIVLDPDLLPEDDRSRYYQIIAGPIEGAVRSARKQLEQSRTEIQGTTTTVLWVVNNGYSALTHDEGFFVNGRPRDNSTGLTHCPAVATTFPDLDRDQWALFREVMPTSIEPFRSYEQWQNRRRRAVASGTPLKPFVPIPVDVAGWEKWCVETGSDRGARSIYDYANAIFDQRARAIMSAARERLPEALLLSLYVLVVTERIGKDAANDVAHISLMREQALAKPIVRDLVTNARLSHEYAIALAAAYALAKRFDSILYEFDLRYAWIC